MKKVKYTFIASFIIAIGLIATDTQTIMADDCGYWTQADRFGRYECAGPADDCYSLCPIIVTPDL